MHRRCDRGRQTAILLDYPCGRLRLPFRGRCRGRAVLGRHPRYGLAAFLSGGKAVLPTSLESPAGPARLVDAVNDALTRRPVHEPFRRRSCWLRRRLAGSMGRRLRGRSLRRPRPFGSRRSSRTRCRLRLRKRSLASVDHRAAVRVAPLAALRPRLEKMLLRLLRPIPCVGIVPVIGARVQHLRGHVPRGLVACRCSRRHPVKFVQIIQVVVQPLRTRPIVVIFLRVARI
mmetsp:Transcript_50642/g.107919  ORF Transcript_50642/g.107919 Transcript_50642/m.107919 type:complete len:230 (-) Transcript_50642:471-1160(-)